MKPGVSPFGDPDVRIDNLEDEHSGRRTGHVHMTGAPFGDEEERIYGRTQ